MKKIKFCAKKALCFGILVNLFFVYSCNNKKNETVDKDKEIPSLETEFVKMEYLISDSFPDLQISISDTQILKIKDLQLEPGTKIYLKNDGAKIVPTTSGFSDTAANLRLPCCRGFKEYDDVRIVLPARICIPPLVGGVLPTKSSDPITYKINNSKGGFDEIKCFEIFIFCSAFVICHSCNSTSCTAIIRWRDGQLISFATGIPRQRPDRQGETTMPCGNCLSRDCEDN